jgi:AGZA family xanthine/uracil permease-like MFS transporter
MPESQSFLERTFGLSKCSTSVRTELIAGLTTFLTMVYIVFVNPTILGSAGMDKGAVFVATCIAAAVSTLVMAFTPIIRSRSRPAWGSMPFSHSQLC